MEADLAAALRLPVASPSHHDGRSIAWPRVGDVDSFFPSGDVDICEFDVDFVG